MGEESTDQKATASNLGTGKKEQAIVGKSEQKPPKNDPGKKMHCRYWVCLRPSILSLIIPLSYVALVFMFFWPPGGQWLSTLLLSILLLLLLLLLWFLFSYLLFPRIVVTIMDLNNIKDINQLYLWADGREIYKYKEADPASLPIQFSFQVWRRGKYDLCLKVVQSGKIKTLMKEANTYEHTVCHEIFELKGG